jgi:hypothetical protein
MWRIIVVTCLISPPPPEARHQPICNWRHYYFRYPTLETCKAAVEEVEWRKLHPPPGEKYRTDTFLRAFCYRGHRDT